MGLRRILNISYDDETGIAYDALTNLPLPWAPVQVGPGVNGDFGTADRTTELQSAITRASAAIVGPKFPSRALNRPTVTLPPGEFRITSSLTGIVSGLRIRGAGKFSTTIYFDNATDTAAFELGTPAASVTDVFSPPGSVQDIEFHDLSIRRWPGATPSNTGVAGSRTGHGIRQTGGGGLRLYNCAFSGFKYGVNSVCGGDFNEVHNTDFEYCDVGQYIGPGAQQIVTEKANYYRCVEGLVLDRVASICMLGPIFNSEQTAGLVIESVTDTSTRQLSSFSISGTSLQQTITLIGPWFEGGAGGATSDIPTHFVKFNLATAETARGLAIRDARVFALSGSKTTTSLIGSTGSIAPQRVLVDGAVFSGVMTNIFYAPGAGSVVRGWVTENGYTQPAIANTSTSAVLWEVLNGSTQDQRVGVAPKYEEFSSYDQTTGVRTEYDFTGGNGIVRYSFKNAGSWLTRFTIDVQNRRTYYGIDGGSPNSSIDFGTAAPVSGTWGVGSIRWNTASGTGVPLGWKCTAAGTPGTWTAMANI